MTFCETLRLVVGAEGEQPLKHGRRRCAQTDKDCRAPFNGMFSSHYSGALVRLGPVLWIQRAGSAQQDEDRV